MATKKQSSAKQSSDAAAAETEAVMDANIEVAKEKEIDPIHVEPTAADLAFADRIGEEMAEAKDAMVVAATPDFAALESRVAQADAAHGAAVASVGTTADELREARAALREARGG